MQLDSYVSVASEDNIGIDDEFNTAKDVLTKDYYDDYYLQELFSTLEQDSYEVRDPHDIVETQHAHSGSYQKTNSVSSILVLRW